MSTARDLQSLLSSAENLAALDALYERTIDQILAEVAAGVTRPGAARARETLIRIRELATRLDPRRDSAVRRWIYVEFPNAYYLGDEAAVSGLESQVKRAAEERAAAFPEIRTAFTALNQLQLKAQIAALTDRLSDVHRHILSRAGIAVRRTQLVFSQDAEVREHVIGGIIRGQTHREVATDIARTILTGQVPPAAAARMREAGFAGDVETWKQMSKGFQMTVGGWTGSARAYANLTARTMQAELHSVGMITRLQQNSINHVRISRHQQAKADVCTLFAGRVYYIGPGTDPMGFPSIKTIPGGHFPPHPNCAHVMEPFVVAVKSPEAVAAALGDAQRLPKKFTAISTKEANELVGAMNEAALNEIAPKGTADVKPPERRGAA